MKKVMSIIGTVVCLAAVLAAANVSLAATPNGDRDLWQCYERNQRTLKMPADCPDEQRELLALTVTSIQTGTTDIGKLRDLLDASLGAEVYVLLSDTSYNWDGAKWVGEFRSTYYYTGGIYTSEEITQMWSGSQWVNYARQTYTYDGLSRLLSSTAQDWETSLWVNSQRYTYSYGGGTLFTEMLVEDWEGGAWVNSLKTTFVYSGDLVSTATTQSWQGGGWVNTTKTIYSYNAGNRVTEFLLQSWQGGSWVNLSRFTYTYDAHYNMTQSLSQTWQGGVWVNTYKDEYTYDGSDRETLHISSLWVEPMWMATDADTSKYSGDLLIEEVHYGILLASLTRGQYTYDAHGNRIVDLDQTWSGAAWVNTGRHVFVYEVSMAVLIDGEQLPAAFELAQNYPNPFNLSTTIRYNLHRSSQVRVAVYNLLGQEVATLDDGVQRAGVYETAWQGVDAWGRPVASGVYFYRITADGLSATRKMILLK